MSDVADSSFYRWIMRHWEAVGRDPNELEPGWAAPAWKCMLVVAATALTEGLNEVQESGLAQILHVDVADVRSAYLPEMRQRVLAGILSHPDLAALDAEAGA